MRRKLLVTDVDGTLLHERVGISPDVIQMAQRFVEKGHLFALCTGRSLRGVRDVAEMLPINVPCPLMTGSILYDFPGQALIHSLPLDPAIHDILRVMMQRHPGLAVQTFTPDNIMTIRRNEIFSAKGIKAEQQTELTAFDEALPEDVCKLLIVHEDRSVLSDCKEMLESYEKERLQGHHFKCDFASRHFMEIVSAQAGKEKALLHLCELLQIPMEDCYVAGDGLTDLPMFQFAGKSFAPEDAIDEVKQAADILFPSAKEHGIKEVFAKIMAEED